MKINPFFIYGMVHPSEYDWRNQFEDIAKHVRARGELYLEMDVGKVLGIVAAYAELLEESKR